MTDLPALNPFVLRLATRLLAKAERSTGCGPFRLKLDQREAPELHGQTDAEEVKRRILLLQDLCDTGWVILILAPAKEFSSFADRNPRLELRDFDALADWASYAPQAAQWHRQWLKFLEARWSMSGANAPRDPLPLLDYLARNPLAALYGLPMEAAAESLELLHRICLTEPSSPLREISAHVFQGRSKILDNRAELLRLLGAATGQFYEAPIQLLVDIPDTFSEALFVENLVTFERMADLRQPDWQNCVLVYAAGFKGSAQRLRTPQGCRLYVRTPCFSGGVRSAPRKDMKLYDVEHWLFGANELPVRFFGDLDFAGMQILRSLREVFPNAQAWVPGYRVLADDLDRGEGHAPCLAAKEQQNDPGTTGCPYADQHLLPLMREHDRFVDQERFSPSKVSP